LKRRFGLGQHPFKLSGLGAPGGTGGPFKGRTASHAWAFLRAFEVLSLFRG
jgi:hypothetical protein